MSVLQLSKAALGVCGSFLNQPGLSLKLLRNLPPTLRGFLCSGRWNCSSTKAAFGSRGADDSSGASSNPLKRYFDSHQEGRGIWKWIHYFDIYQRHLQQFVGKEVHILEIGIYSGGSLDMWKHYFGPKCHVYGVDIEPACKRYEGERSKVLVGDQADPAFWKRFKAEVPSVDILIDDGGHLPEQQIVTLEEMLPHLRPGGVYLCEDVHGTLNGFSAYVHGLADNLNATCLKSGLGKEQGHLATATPFQRAIRSIHLYPFVCVIEKALNQPDEFIAPKHGTEWQPFL
jgi:hypothetical protein